MGLNLLRRNKHPHPLIYMRGLKSEDLVAMVDFIYFGEANVDQENLDSFLNVAEELQLKGLMGSSAEEEPEDVNKKPLVKKKAKISQKQKGYSKQDSTTHENFSFVAKVESTPHLEGTVAVTDYTVAVDLQDLDDKIKSMMEVSENRVGARQEIARVCKVCGKEGKWAHIRDHIEANHFTGVSYTCNICGTTTRTRHAMRHHNTKHKSNPPPNA